MPIAIRYGVPMDIFWDLNPKKLDPWQRMFEFRQQEEADKRDYDAWLQGQYFAAAIGAAFDGQKSPYPSEPFSITQRRDEQAEANRVAADKFWAFAMAFNKRFQQQQEQQ